MVRRLLVTFVILCIGASSSLALDFMGAPVAGLKKGQFSFGPVYSYSKYDIEIDRLEAWGDDFNLTFLEQTIDDIEINRYSVRLGYGIENWWEINLSAGLSDIDIDSLNYSSGTGYSFKLGTKITIAEQDNLSLGTLFQASWLNTDDSFSWSEGGNQYDANIDIDVVEMQFAVGPALDLGGWSLYGGAVAYFIQGDGDAELNENGIRIASGSGDIDNDSQFGGYIGTQVEIATNTDFTIEYVIIEDGWGYGTAIAWKF